MKTLIALVACGFLMGCDYTVPLVQTPEMPLDPEGIGLWERTKGDGQTERLLALPLGEHEYLVSFPAGSENAMFARACLLQRAGRTLVQLEWIGTVQGGLPEDDRVFQFATFSISGDTLSTRLLNPDVVDSDAESTAELSQVLADEKDHPDLFRSEWTFKRVND